MRSGSAGKIRVKQIQRNDTIKQGSARRDDCLSWRGGWIYCSDGRICIQHSTGQHRRLCLGSTSVALILDMMCDLLCLEALSPIFSYTNEDPESEFEYARLITSHEKQTGSEIWLLAEWWCVARHGALRPWMFHHYNYAPSSIPHHLHHRDSQAPSVSPATCCCFHAWAICSSLDILAALSSSAGKT